MSFRTVVATGSLFLVLSVAPAGAQTVPAAPGEGGTSAAAGEATSLAELFRAARRHHPLLEAARDDARAAREGVAQAQAAYRPNLTLQGSISTADRDATLQDGSDFEETISPQSASLRLDQVIYAGGRRALATQAAAARFGLGRASYLTEEQAVFGEVIQAYVSLSLARETVGIRRGTADLIGRRRDAVVARQRVGDASRFDLSQTRARLARADADLAGADVQLTVARETLASLTGIDRPIDLGPFRAAEPLPPLDALRRLALAHSPLVETGELRARSARLEVASVARQRLPTLSLTGSASTSREASPVVDEETNLQVGLSLQMPIYQGGQVTSQAREAAARYASTRHRLDDQRRRVLLQVTTLHAEIEGATARIRTARAGLEAARDALRGTERSFEVGLVDEVRVLDAIEDQLEAELSLVLARHEWFRSYLLLQLVTGQLEGS